jgi:hypothetical protein
MPSNFKFKISINNITLIFQDLPTQNMNYPHLADGVYNLEIIKDNKIVLSDKVTISNPNYEDE